MKCTVIALPRNEIFKSSLDYSVIAIPVFPHQIIHRLDSKLYTRDAWFSRASKEVNDSLTASASQSTGQFTAIQSAISRYTEDDGARDRARQEDRIRVYICARASRRPDAALHELIYDNWCIAAMAAAAGNSAKSAGLAPVNLYDFTPTTATLNLERTKAMMMAVKQRAEDNGVSQRAVFTLYA